MTKPTTQQLEMMLNAVISPREFDLPHQSWRPNQWETIEYLKRVEDGKVVLLQAPTGSGKTSLSKAMMKFGGVTTLVKTKGLQVENYSKGYNFDVLFGRANYPCIHPERDNPEDTANECIYEDKMNMCEYADECPYLMQKHLVQDSDVRSLNYSYFLTAKWPRLPEYVSDYLFLDECHNLPDETLEYVSCTIREGQRLKWRLPEFPAVYSSTTDGVQACLKWMADAKKRLYAQYKELEGATDGHSKSLRSKAFRLFSKLHITSVAVETEARDWYCRSGQRALDYQGSKVPGMVVKPLTARYHFPKLFLNMYPKTILMSATIGNHLDYADELGIKDYEFHEIPNQWPPESRPVHVADVPSIGYKSTEAMKQKQAQEIAKALNGLPGDWSGIIHVTSWKQAWDLRGRLTKAGVKSGRLFIPDRGGTNKQIEQWNRERDSGAGMLVITPSMNAGVDLRQERICIIAKTPFPYCAPGSYEYERMKYSNKFYRWQTASDLEQRAGRTRRGNKDDYDTDWAVNGYVGIFDGSFKKMGLQKSCSEDFRRGLVYD